MDEKHRSIIRRLHPQMCEDLDLGTKFYAEMVQAKIFTDNQLEEIKVKATNRDKVSKLLELLPKRGPDAFRKFVELVRKDHSWLADELEKQKYIQRQPGAEKPVTEDQSQSVQKLSMCPNCSSSFRQKHHGVFPTHHFEPSGSATRSNRFLHDEKLRKMHTKLKVVLCKVNLREQSFRSSPQPISYDTVESLMDQLIKLVMDSNKAIGENNKESLPSNILMLKSIKEEKERILDRKEEQVEDTLRKYTRLQIENKDIVETNKKIKAESQKLKEENKNLKEKIQELRKINFSEHDKDARFNDRRRYPNLNIAEKPDFEIKEPTENGRRLGGGPSYINQKSVEKPDFDIKEPNEIGGRPGGGPSYINLKSVEKPDFEIKEPTENGRRPGGGPTHINQKSVEKLDFDAKETSENGRRPGGRPNYIRQKSVEKLDFDAKEPSENGRRPGERPNYINQKSDEKPDFDIKEPTAHGRRHGGRQTYINQLIPSSYYNALPKGFFRKSNEENEVCKSNFQYKDGLRKEERTLARHRDNTDSSENGTKLIQSKGDVSDTKIVESPRPTKKQTALRSLKRNQSPWKSKTYKPSASYMKRTEQSY